MSLVTNVSLKRTRDEENHENQPPCKRRKVESLHDLIKNRAPLEDFRFAVQTSANLNLKILGETALQLSIRLLKSDEAEILLKVGALRPAIVRTSDSLTPTRAHCEWMCLHKLLPYFPQDQISEELVFRKFLAHIYSIQGETALGNYLWVLVGGNEDFFLPILTKSIEKLIKDERKQQLLSSLKILESVSPINWALNTPSSQQQLIKSYKNKNPIILPLQGEEHFYTLVLNKNYLIICNRGDGRPPNHSTFSTYVIDPQKVTAELLTWIYDNQYNYAAIYFDLPLKLRLFNIDKDILCEVLETFEPKLQKAENCAYTNLTAAIKAAWLSIKVIPEKYSFTQFDDYDSYIQKAEDARWKYNVWSYVFRTSQLHRYVTRTSNVPRDQSLIEQCQAKALKQKKCFEIKEYVPIINNSCGPV